METNKIELGFNWGKEDRLSHGAREMADFLNLVVIPTLRKLHLEVSKEKALYYGADINHVINDYYAIRGKGIDKLPPALQDATRDRINQELKEAIKNDWGKRDQDEETIKVLIYSESKSAPFVVDVKALHDLCVRYVEPHQIGAYKAITEALEALNKALKGNCTFDLISPTEPVFMEGGKFYINGGHIDLDKFV